MKNIICIVLFTLAVISCEQKTESETNSYEDVEIIKQIDPEIEDYQAELEPQVEIKRGSISIEYPNFDFTISHQTIYGDGLVNKQNSDTTQLYLDLGEYLDSAIIEIHHDGLYNIDIYQMYENSLTINNEGPHCDLVNWEHYYSDWVALKKHNNYDFVAETYTREDYDRFIDADITEFQDAVLESCGKEWAERVVDVKTFNDYPCSVGMSRILFKIVLTNEEAGKNIEQIIAFEVPMGC